MAFPPYPAAYNENPLLLKTATQYSAVRDIDRYPFVAAPPLTGNVQSIPDGRTPDGNDRICTYMDAKSKMNPNISRYMQYSPDRTKTTLPYLVANRSVNEIIMIPQMSGQSRVNGNSIDYTRSYTQ